MKTNTKLLKDLDDTPVSKSVLFNMLTMKRPYGGEGVTAFRETFLRDIDGADSVLYDEMGDTLVSVGFKLDVSDDGDIVVSEGTLPATMFSAHIDTVHREDGVQLVKSSFYNGIETVELADKQDTHCLGSDDAAGCWVLLNLIKEGIKGLYVFHNGEECGGIGSGFLSSNYPEFFRNFSHCIAIDRKGTDSIITHQMSGKCCSDLFANTLGDAIGLGHRPDDTGLYTDSAEYTHLIPECTNISSGYYNEHTLKENLNLTYLQDLVLAMLTVDYESLPVSRDSADNGWPVYTNYPTYRDYDDYVDIEDELHYDRGYTYYEDLVFQDPYQAAQLLYEAYSK